jgi:hypothetical protein
MNMVSLNTQNAHSLPFGYVWLAEQALEANLFFEPAFLLPSLEHLASKEIDICVARDSESGVPLATLPVRRARGRYGPVPTPQPLVTWLSPYAMLGTPLVSSEDPELALEKLLDTLAQRRDGAPVLLLPMLPQASKVWPLLQNVVATSGRRMTVLRTFQRAGLTVKDPGVQNLHSLLGKNSFRSHKKSRKQFSALGALTHEVATEPSTMARALDAFFALEASGWKGRSGTAMRTTGHEAFASTAVMGLVAEGRARADLTLLDGTPIAGTLSLSQPGLHGPVWMPWKIAYDERYALQGAGARSLADLTEHLLAQADEQGVALELDSLASPDSVLANRMWRHPRVFIDVAIDLQPGGSAAFSAILVAERARERAYKAARYARDLVAAAKRGTRSKQGPRSPQR